MTQFTVYSTGSCPYCIQAKLLLEKLQHTYVEHRVDLDDSLMEEVKTRAPHVRTVPQIFLNNYHIGGFDDLKRLVDEDQLDMIIDMQS